VLLAMNLPGTGGRDCGACNRRATDASSRRRMAESPRPLEAASGGTGATGTTRTVEWPNPRGSVGHTNGREMRATLHRRRLVGRSGGKAQRWSTAFEEPSTAGFGQVKEGGSVDVQVTKTGSQRARRIGGDCNTRFSLGRRCYVVACCTRRRCAALTLRNTGRERRAAKVQETAAEVGA
jgi:hypothetical protein